MSGLTTVGQVQIPIAGIPAAGNSTFGKWLAEEKGFIHVDMELCSTEPYSWGWNGLSQEWEAFCKGSDRDALIRKLKGLPGSVVLNWGFPAHTLPVVSALKARGVSLWWFDGDRAVARNRYKQRAKMQLSAPGARCRQPAQRPLRGWIKRLIKLNQCMVLFDNQYRGLARSWPDIEPLFRDHIIETLRPDGSFMNHEEILSRIMGALTDAAPV